MDNRIFISKEGLQVELEDNDFIETEETFVVIKQGSQLLCVYDEDNGIYSFPNIDFFEIEEEPSYNFTIHCDVYYDETFIYETQNYYVYEVEDAGFSSDVLKWLPIEDILINKYVLDATQKQGFKNLFVRLR